MDAGARGCYIIVAGKLSGQRHRTEKFKEGSIKYCGEPKLLYVDHGYAVAKLKMGTIGVTVEIMQSDAKLPAEATIVDRDTATQRLPDLFNATATPAEEAQRCPRSKSQTSATCPPRRGTRS